MVSPVTGGIFQNQPVAWTMNGWYLVWTGEYPGRTKLILMMDVGQPPSIGDQDHIESGVTQVLILDGERYWKLVEKQCKYPMGSQRELSGPV